MQDHLLQTMVVSQRCSQTTLTEQAASKTKGNAAYEAMEAAIQTREWQAETRRLFEQKCKDAAEDETNYSAAIKDTLDESEAPEKTHHDREHEGGVLGDHGGRLLQNPSRPSKLCQTRSAQ